MSTATNEIKKASISSLGFNFIDPKYLPKGKDEFYLRNLQNKNGIIYRQLSAYEIEVLVRNRNTAADWNTILVSDAFNAELVKNCKFYGLVRIGKLEPYFLEFSDLKVPVGLYNSTIISCDFGDNVVVDNVNYLSHYIIGNEAIIVNVNELVTSNYAKFGNGIVKQDEDEQVRIWLELCNENGGRKVIPFNGMLPGDAYLWTKYRDDDALLDKFKLFTEAKFDKRRGYYGKIGNRTVIKNCKIIKDVWIGEDAYLKGANKLKNLTINSGAEGKSQIGEGCEMVNGIMGFGCRAFYGVKAVRFIMASHSQLKYGARLINSYLGNNATISCCEVLNSLIFPAHEQHHNNSFLCAALIMGQSNIAAGATIGSNHNSRSADGELIAGRGFWPGLCVSLKHNSKFASYTMLSKGDYPSELNIPFPFSLVSNDVANDQLLVMPGYWYMYNMYALERNTWKYIDRDKRVEKFQHIEYDHLAPDTVNEMMASLEIFEQLTGRAFLKKDGIENAGAADEIAAGKQLLFERNSLVNELVIEATGFENSKRKVVIKKVLQAYTLFHDLIELYAVGQICAYQKIYNAASFRELLTTLPSKLVKEDWQNIGGQLMPTNDVALFIAKVKTGKIKSWDDVHDFYLSGTATYTTKKCIHALSCLQITMTEPIKKISAERLKLIFTKAIQTKEWMNNGIHTSRAKDYTNPFRKMAYANTKEMNAVLGPIEENSFIAQQNEELRIFKKQIAGIRKLWKL